GVLDGLAKRLGRGSVEHMENGLVSRQERCPDVADAASRAGGDPGVFPLRVDPTFGSVRLDDVGRHDRRSGSPMARCYASAAFTGQQVSPSGVLLKWTIASSFPPCSIAWASTDS